MMDDNARNETFIDLELDLNHEPLNDPSSSSVPELGPLLNHLGTAHDQIEERIRLLEAVTARARSRQTQNAPQSSDVVTQINDNWSHENTLQNGDCSVDRAKGCKMDSYSLVGRALQFDAEVGKAVGKGTGFFDCNVCLRMAREPVLTCCGHLFCWICFYYLPCVYSTTKECPVCMGEVPEKNITPIYGNGKNDHVEELAKFGFKIPPRPKAQRKDSVRQQRFGLGVSHIPVVEALRRIRAGIGATSTNPQETGGNSANIIPDGNSTEVQVLPAVVTPNNVSGRRLRSRQFSRLLSETAASLSTISSALNGPRLFRDIELFVNDDIVVRRHEDPHSMNATLIEPSNQTSDSTAHAASHASPDAPAVPPRRRNRRSRASNGENGVRRESRRRRLS